MPAARPGWVWPAILQHDLDGRLLFTHACQGKDQLRRGVRLGALPQADAAVRAAGRLNRQWSPVGDRDVWNPRAPSVRALAAEIRCVHRGAKRPGGEAEVERYDCAIHGACTVREDVGERTCVGCGDFLVRKTAGPRRVVRVEGLGTHPPAFNASAIEFGGRTVLAYRLKREDSEIWTCELDGRWRASGNRRLDLPRDLYNRRGCEDPRFFVHGGRLHLAYTGLQDAHDQVTNVLYCRLGDDLGVEEHFHPLYDQRAPWEKNWQFFGADGELWAVYAIAPHVVLKVRGHHTQVTYRHEWPVLWKGGVLRGGASPVRLEGQFYCFFHGVSHEPTGKVYAMGCYTFEAAPPFRPLRVTQQPLLPPVPRWESDRCVFPCGAFLRDGRWFVTYGYQNREVRVAEFGEQELEESLVAIPRPL
jgi:predicted GH43/DUF377 family glycosyl hydrolase